MGAKIGLYIFNKYGQEKYYEFHNKLMSEAGRAMKDRKDYTPSNLAAPSMVWDIKKYWISKVTSCLLSKCAISFRMFLMQI